jgi:uncharacterized metal-binding protein
MPSGRVHSTATALLALASVPVGSPAFTVGILSGLILSPDLDVDAGFIGLAHLRRVGCVGNILSGIWRAFWYPYSKLVPHRSHISHSILFGTLARVGYLLLPLLAVNVMGVPLAIPSWFACWLLGLCLSDAAHIIMDWMKK